MDPQDPNYDPYDRLEFSDGARVEDDTVKPLTRVHTPSRGRLPAALSFAVVGLLVIAGMAFGANVVLPMVGSPNNTPIIVPDETEPPAAVVPTDEPTATPTEAPTEEPTTAPTDEPTVEPTQEPTAAPTDEPTAAPTDKPEPTQRPNPTAPPTPAGPVNLGAIAVTSKGNGCYRFSWKGYSGVDFSYWKLVYGDWGTSPYYPAFPYWAVLDPGTTSWEGCVDPGDYAVRVQAIYYPNGSTKAAAQTAILHLTVSDTTPVPATVNLGNMTVTKGADGCYTFSWASFNAVDFNYWKLVYGEWGTEPYYPAFNYWAALDPSTTSFRKCGIPAGDYAVRVQAIYYPRGAAYAAAQSSIYHLTVTAPTPTVKPSPVALTLNASATADGITLSWSKYTGAGFQYYKVVRSTTNTNPMYPENSGTTLVAAIDGVGTLSFTDCDVTAGETYYYRVVAYTFDGGGAVLGKSNVKTVQAV